MTGSLARFSLIVAIDASGGISKNGALPWSSRADMSFFRSTTTGRGKNAVIMGRKTYETIPDQHRPLKNRHCCVVSRSWRQAEHREVRVFGSISDTLLVLGSISQRFDKVFVIGGEQIYAEVVDRYLYLCDALYVTRFREEFECDKFFPWDAVKNFHPVKQPAICQDFTRYHLAPQIVHEEHRYLDLLREVQEAGAQKPDRTGVGVRSLIGRMLKFDISKQVPIVTTKKINYDAVVRELLFFVSGRTDTTILSEQKVNIWKKNTSASFLAGRGLDHYPVGEMGPMYGHQWRHYGAPYRPGEAPAPEEGVDQLQTVVDQIIKNPHSRRHLITAWNPCDLDKMALAPCHDSFQFHVSGCNRFLDCTVRQRSADCFLGLPFNIASYAILAHMVAQLCSLQPRELTFFLGDVHLYATHTTQVAQQLSRTPKPFPTVRFEDAHRIRSFADFTVENIVVDDYECWPAIHAEMAV